MNKHFNTVFTNAAKLIGKTIYQNLDCLKFEPDGNDTLVSSNDLVSMYQGRLRGVKTNKPFLVDCKDFRKAIKALPDLSTLHHEHTGPDNQIVTINNLIKIPAGGDLDEFPSNNHEFDLSEFEAIDVSKLPWVAKAMSKDVTRYNLNGVFVGRSGILVATDGYRLHTTDKDKTMDGMIIPDGAVKLLNALKAKTAYVKHDSANLDFCVLYSDGDHTIISRKIQAEYPDYITVSAKIYPPATTFTTGRVELTNAVKTVMGSMPKVGKAVNIDINESPAVEFSLDDAYCKVPIQGDVNGAEVLFAAQPQFLLDALTESKDANVSFSFWSDRDTFFVDNNALLMPHKRTEVI